jgi:hypothetical protein
VVCLPRQLSGAFRSPWSPAIALFRLIGLKAATFGAGVAIKKSLDYGFDYLLYPFALIWLGYFWGGAAMTAASVIINLAVIRAYDWSKRDWLLLETIKEFKDRPDGLVGRPLVGWIVRRGDLAAFFILSWVEDPIVVTLYLRRNAHQFNGLARRDWMIFGASTIVSNLFWIFGLVSALELFRFASRHFGLS